MDCKLWYPLQAFCWIASVTQGICFDVYFEEVDTGVTYVAGEEGVGEGQHAEKTKWGKILSRNALFIAWHPLVTTVFLRASVGGLFIFTIRVDSYDPVEYGYSAMCEKLEQTGKWSLVLKEKRELHATPNAERLRYCYLITYKVLQWRSDGDTSSKARAIFLGVTGQSLKR